MDAIVNAINDIVWSNALVVLCILSGIYFSVMLKFPQVRYFKEMIRLLFNKNTSQTGVSSFQAFAIALSGRVGTGNIAGVATAIAMGGPGAIFWMWAIAFLGASSALVESTLAQIYKKKVGDEFRGGPSYYIEKGLGLKWYAVLFTIATLLSNALFLPGVQSNSIAGAAHIAFALPFEYTGYFLVILLGIIIFGGVKRIAKIAEFVVPFMAGGYILMAIIIIAYNYRSIPEVFSLILSSAFGQNSLFGGIVGSAIAWGVKRGIYSNEAGQGSAPHAAAAANTDHPVQQGLVQAFSVYIDTLLVCTATAFLILFTDSYYVQNPDGSMLVEKTSGLNSGASFTQAAIDSVFPSLGSGFVAIALFFFAFTTLMAYYYIAETNLAYITKNEKIRTYLTYLLRFVLLGSVFYGTIKTSNIAWALGDIGVGIMAWLNIVAIFLLRKKLFAAFKDFESKFKTGDKISFKAKDIDIHNSDYWK